ncbi:MAG TPA: transcription antitermination factor NusB [Enhygromyxa sp.]|nr:transcription antitermination factor NusB [Enhygromyxa sp.]
MAAAEQSGAHRGSNRARGRELALWILCHLESHPDDEREAVELFWHEPPAIEPGDAFFDAGADELAALLVDPNARRFAQRLVDSFLDHAAQTDARIEGVSARWRMARMDRVDRNLLRIAAVELAHQSTPRNVVVAEAVRLAARYGSERSVAFVNGLAEALARELRDSGEGTSSERTDEGDGEDGGAT